MNRLFRYLVPLSLALAVCFAPLLDVKADVGNAHSSGGNSYSGGGSSYSSGSSNSFGNSSRYFTHSSSSGSRGQSSNGSIVFNLGILVVVILIKYGASQVKKNLKTKTFEVTSGHLISELKASDPSFNEEEFKTFAGHSFLALQSAWSQRDWESVRLLESNELFETHKKQLDEYVSKGHWPILEDQTVDAIFLTKYETDGPYEFLEVRLSAHLMDYVVDDSGEVVSGYPDRVYNRDYRLLFKRTKLKKEAATICPSCHAPLETGASGICPYCGSLITTSEYDWVMDAYDAWRD